MPQHTVTHTARDSWRPVTHGSLGSYLPPTHGETASQGSDHVPAEHLLGSTVSASRALGGEATYLRLADGRELVLKGVPRQSRPTWQPGAPWAELVLLDLLAAEGAPVPRLLAADPKAGWLVRTYEPGLPLSRALATEAESLFAPCLHALNSVERILQREADYIAPYTTEQAAATWDAMRRSVSALLTPTAQATWDDVSGRVLHPDARTLGLLDVNAENALWRDGSVLFIDLASVGPDYPERRLTAYLQVVAPSPASALTEEAYARYLEEHGEEAAWRLALFDLLFWLTALSRIRLMRTQPDHPVAQGLRRAWGDPETLRRPLLTAWHRRRFDDTELARIISGLRIELL